MVSGLHETSQKQLVFCIDWLCCWALTCYMGDCTPLHSSFSHTYLHSYEGSQCAETQDWSPSLFIKMKDEKTNLEDKILQFYSIIHYKQSHVIILQTVSNLEQKQKYHVRCRNQNNLTTEAGIRIRGFKCHMLACRTTPTFSAICKYWTIKICY